MNILYNDKTDLLYIRLDDRKQDVVNRRVSEDIVLDIGERDRIVGIEILDASKHVALERLLPVTYAQPLFVTSSYNSSTKSVRCCPVDSHLNVPACGWRWQAGRGGWNRSVVVHYLGCVGISFFRAANSAVVARATRRRHPPSAEGYGGGRSGCGASATMAKSAPRYIKSRSDFISKT